ncbi:reverse transcriptase [Cooperia oncophora]
MIPKEQHGFLSGASTVSNLLDSLFDWQSALNNGKSVDIVFVDLSKAFDRVCHRRLLVKLQHLGISGQLLDWLRSFLNQRYMTVKVRHSFSDRHHCQSGVPQGSVLSPLLFLVYTLDLPAYITTSPEVKVQMYADDIKIYAAYDTTNKSEVQAAFRLSLAKMSEWAASWGLTINLNKCSLLHLGDNVSPRPCSERSGSFGLSYLKIQKRFYSIMFNSYFYRMARMLDKLPPELLRSENGKVFKNRLRKICITDSLHSLF